MKFSMRYTMKKNKYNAKKTIIDGLKFDSKAEAKRYSELKLDIKKHKDKYGRDAYILCQVPFRLPGRIIYRIDFMFVSTNNECCSPGCCGDTWITYEDVKGILTDVSRIKIKQVQEIYGITINLITKKGVVNL